MLQSLRFFLFIFQMALKIGFQSLLRLERKFYMYFGLLFAACVCYAVHTLALGLHSIGLNFTISLLQISILLMKVVAICHVQALIAFSAFVFSLKLIASRIEIQSIRLAAANIRAYSASFEVAASGKVSALSNYLYQLVTSYERAAKHAHPHQDSFFQKIIKLGTPGQNNIESFIESNLMPKEIIYDELADPIPVIDMLECPFQQNAQQVTLELFHHARRVYSMTIPHAEEQQRYTLQVVTKDILKKEIAAREMATLLGLGDCIPPFAVYSAPEGLSADQDYNLMQDRIEGVLLSSDSMLTLEQINVLPEQPEASFIILRKFESDINLKKLVYQLNYVEEATPLQRNMAAAQLELLDVVKTQKVMILQYMLGLRSDLNDLTFIEGDAGVIKSLYHSQMMPDNNYGCPGTHIMNNSALAPQSTRGRHLVSQVVLENMKSLQLPILALQAAVERFKPELQIALAPVSELTLIKYHQAKNLFNPQAVIAQNQRLRILQRCLAQGLTPRDMVQFFQPLDMTFELHLVAMDEQAKSLFYTHFSQCPITPYRETHFTFAQWAFDAGVERQKNQYQRLLCFDGRSTAQRERLLDNYYHKEIRDSLKRAPV